MLSGLDNPIHLLILGLIVLMLFGAKRLPEMGRALGSGMHEFKDGVLGRETGTTSRGALEPSSQPSESHRHRNAVG
jgi:TatA/E family protein of Tat protein translocase